MANSSFNRRWDDPPRKCLVMGPDALLKPVEDPKREAGELIELAIRLGAGSKKQLSIDLGYPPGDQAVVSRWIAGTETPQWHRLLKILWFRQGLVLALAISTPGVRSHVAVSVPMQVSA